MMKNKFLVLSLLGFLVLFSQKGYSQDRSYKMNIDNAVNWIKSGQYFGAAQQLYPLARTANISEEKNRAKYLLGVSFMEQNLNQLAAVQFVEVIRAGDATWTKYAIEKLLTVTDKLGDETLLNYALQRIDVNQVPLQNREILYYRLAEIKHGAGLYQEAINNYSQVSSKSRYYYSALYNMGLAQSESNQLDSALQTFSKLLATRQIAKVTDTNKVAAQIGMARVYYQRKEWNKAIEAYSKIPRDHAMWHDALFEKTWSMLRAGRFRSTLSNFQTLHSAYYEDEYLPETLLLRAIVYLYICQYDEMEKVLSLYEKQYNPSLRQITAFLQNSNSEIYFKEIEKAFLMKGIPGERSHFSIPFKVLKHVAEEGDVRRGYAYYKKVMAEKRRLESDSNLGNANFSPYAKRILANRIANIKSILGETVKSHLENVKTELADLNEQAGFIRYEMINGKKETLKKRLANQNANSGDSSVEKQVSLLVENGYEFYPFQGEYWLDEIGNYHYLGNKTCE